MGNFHKRGVKILLFTYLFLLAPLFYTPAAWASFTLDDEKKLGKEFYEKLLKDNMIFENEKANAYLKRLGELILSYSDKLPFSYRFSIINSNGINAFATPGGYVYVNLGLINLVENEGELAGVLAHEIAHINGRHIAEMVDRSKKVNISTLAAIIAGAFLGGGGELTAAVTGFSMATATALSLQYSREHEEAADRGGFSYLTAAGYNGRFMLDFLKIMRKYEYYSNTVPSYFFTHPGTDDRIGYIDSLIQTSRHKGGAEEIIGGLKRIKTLLRLNGDDPSENLKFFREELADRPNDGDALYGLAATEGKLGMTKEALDHFQKALSLNPEDSDILRDFGIFLVNLGRFQDAAFYLRQAAQSNKNDVEAGLYWGKAELAVGNTAEALHILKNLESKKPNDPEVCYNLAVAYGKTSQKGLSHYYFGRYFKMKAKKESALFHFRAALKEFPENDKKATEIRKEMQSFDKKPNSGEKETPFPPTRLQG